MSTSNREYNVAKQVNEKTLNVFVRVVFDIFGRMIATGHDRRASERFSQNVVVEIVSAVDVPVYPAKGYLQRYPENSRYKRLRARFARIRAMAT